MAGHALLFAAGVALAGGALLTALWLAGSPGTGDGLSVGPVAGQAGPASPGAAAGSVERYVVLPEQSQATYRVGETLLRFSRPNVAVGTTRAISGEILLDRQRPSATRLGVFSVDISQLRSDEPRRDQAIRERWLESARYPVATFRTLSIEGMPEELQDGRPVAVTLHGELTIRTVTRPVAFQGSFQLDGDILRGTARATIRMTDFGFEPPTVFGVLRADDQVEVEVTIVARRAG